MQSKKPENVDEYISTAAQEAQPILHALRQIIAETVPDATETISYGVPFYKYFGEFVGFAAYKNHVSFGYGRDVLAEEIQSELVKDGYRLGKGTMQIGFDQAVPKVQIQAILAKKAALNRENKMK